jgi:hypothetical protein
VGFSKWYGKAVGLVDTWRSYARRYSCRAKSGKTFGRALKMAMLQRCRSTLRSPGPQILIFRRVTRFAYIMC